MLIRSQDKEKLLDFTGCTAMVNIENEVIIWGNNYPADEPVTCVGLYQTKERAIEILDMIASAYGRNQSGNTYSDAVFYMPED